MTIWTLLADAVDDKAEESLAIELGNCSAITGKGGVDENCVWTTVVDSASTWETAVGFPELLRSFGYSQR